MDPTTVLPFFRTQWVSRMQDSCVVKRETSTSFNESTGVYTPTYTNQYSGVCLVRPANPSDADFGQEQAELRFYNVFITHSETDPLPNDLVDITSDDSFLNGKQFTVRNVYGDTYLTVRRLLCEEIVNG